MRLVVVESPYAGDIEKNANYARAAMADCLKRGDAPFASHLLYTQPGVLRDQDPEERKLGIHAGLLWGNRADATVVYVDLGISKGMEQGIERARMVSRPVEQRTIPVSQDYCCDCWVSLRHSKVCYGAGDGSKTGRDGRFRCEQCHQFEPKGPWGSITHGYASLRASRASDPAHRCKWCGGGESHHVHQNYVRMSPDGEE